MYKVVTDSLCKQLVNIPCGCMIIAMSLFCSCLYNSPCLALMLTNSVVLQVLMYAKTSAEQNYPQNLIYTLRR